MLWIKAKHTLELALAERGGVAGNDDQLGLSRSESLEGRLVTKGDLSGLHYQGQARVDVVGCRMVSRSFNAEQLGTNRPSWSSWWVPSQQ